MRLPQMFKVREQSQAPAKRSDAVELLNRLAFNKFGNTPRCMQCWSYAKRVPGKVICPNCYIKKYGSLPSGVYIEDDCPPETAKEAVMRLVQRYPGLSSVRYAELAQKYYPERFALGLEKTKNALKTILPQLRREGVIKPVSISPVRWELIQNGEDYDVNEDPEYQEKTQNLAYKRWQAIIAMMELDESLRSWSLSALSKLQNTCAASLRYYTDLKARVTELKSMTKKQTMREKWEELLILVEKDPSLRTKNLTEISRINGVDRSSLSKYSDIHSRFLQILGTDKKHLQVKIKNFEPYMEERQEKARQKWVEIIKLLQDDPELRTLAFEKIAKLRGASTKLLARYPDLYDQVQQLRGKA